MENKILKTNRNSALVAGFSLLLMAVVAGYGFGYAFQNTYVANSGAATLQNLLHSGNLIRIFLLSFSIVLALDIVVSWYLFVFFKQVNKPLSLLLAVFRLIYAVFLGVSLLSIVSIIQSMTYAPLNEMAVMNSFNTFLNVWSAGLIVFGCHLFVLGILIFKAGFIPKWLGVLVLFASVCYIITNAANLLLPNYVQYKETVDMVLGMPMALGELALALWLVFKGGKEAKVY